MPSTSGMKGSGYYDANSGPQRAAMEAYLPWLVEAIALLPESPAPSASFSLLDLGSSEGRNALHAMRSLVDALRKRSPAPIFVFFCDLPTNDFNQLFLNLFPARSHAFTASDVFPAAIGGSAYGCVVPPATLHVATSFNTIGWLESRPDAPLPRFLGPMGPAISSERVSVSEAEREPYRKEAVANLLAFYHARAVELVPGGKLLVQVFGRNSTRSTSDGLYDVMSDALLGLIDDGQLEKQVYENLVFAVYLRTIEELIAPIQTDETLARVFRLDKAESIEVDVPFNLELERTGDTQSWASAYTAFIRAITESVIAAELPSQAPVRETLLDQIYQRIERLLLANPDRYKFHYISIGALLTRV